MEKHSRTKENQDIKTGFDQLATRRKIFFVSTSQLFRNWNLKDNNNSCIRTQELNSVWYLNYLTWASSKETNVRKAQISLANSINIVLSVFLFYEIHYEAI